MSKKKTIQLKVKMYQPKSKPTKQGIKVELEHTPSKRLAGLIAGNHLDEDKQYYSKLKKVEKKKK
jgi:hypothetical protein